MTPLRAVAAIGVLSGFAGFSSATPAFVARIPNGASVAGAAALGHVDSQHGGGSRNAFGNAFEAAGCEWTVTLCLADSDGDGQTNGQELGDPCCVWRVGQIPTFATGTSHPGNASSTVDESILWQWVCGYPNDHSFSGSVGDVGGGAHPGSRSGSALGGSGSSTLPNRDQLFSPVGDATKNATNASDASPIPSSAASGAQSVATLLSFAVVAGMGDSVLSLWEAATFTG